MKVPEGRHVVVGVVIVVVIAAVVGGLFLLGSPGEERLRQLDRKRVDDLRNISNAIDLYWTRQKHLPNSLEELAQQPGAGPSLRDPTRGQLYEYHVRTAGGYELCASFQRGSDDQSSGGGRDFWWHGAGRQCFRLEARDVPR